MYTVVFVYCGTTETFLSLKMIKLRVHRGQIPPGGVVDHTENKKLVHSQLLGHI